MRTHAINVTLEQDHATISLAGEHEAYSADRLSRTLGGLLAEGAAVTVDLTQAVFVDSTVIGVLIASARRADEAGLPFRLLLGEHTGWPVRRMLEVTGLATQLDVVG